MISKLEFVLFGVMIIGWSSYIEAKNIEHLNMTDAKMQKFALPQLPDDHSWSTEVATSVTSRNENFCQLCRNITTRVLNILKENETQTEIITSLHQVCSHLHSLEQQCILLVDNYMSIFAMKIAKLQPKQLCKKVKLCDKIELVHQVKHDDPCTICHNVVNEVLTSLDDPDAQLEIIQTLLKGCNRIEKFSHQCKRLVLEYGPIILVKADIFFQKTDVCAAIHACQANRMSDIGREFIAVA